MNSLNYLVRAREAISHERLLAQAQARSTQQIAKIAWANLEHALQLSLDLSDIAVKPHLDNEFNRLPHNPDLVRIQFPSLTEEVGFTPEIFASVVLTMLTTTGEVVYARANQCYYAGADGLLHHAASLQHALMYAIEAHRPTVEPALETQEVWS